MNILGYEVAAELLAAAVIWMSTRNKGFTALELEVYVSTFGGVPRDGKGTAMRVADRLIQRERKTGNIAFGRDRLWRWVAT